MKAMGNWQYPSIEEDILQTTNLNLQMLKFGFDYKLFSSESSVKGKARVFRTQLKVVISCATV